MANVIAEHDVFVAWQGHIAEDWVVAAGERVRGNDKRYLRSPEMFVRDGTPRSEWPTVADAVAEQLKPENVARREREEAERNRVLVAPPDLMVARRDVVGGYQGRLVTVAKGSVLFATDPLVLEFPGDFKVADIR
jgi:hypothetical protein